jgi:hypothetical protein
VTRGAGGSPAVGFTDASKLHFGFNVGAGIDHAVTNNVFIGVEYQYLDLGKETYNLGAFTPAGAAAQTVSSTVDLKASEVTAGSTSSSAGSVSSACETGLPACRKRYLRIEEAPDRMKPTGRHCFCAWLSSTPRNC